MEAGKRVVLSRHARTRAEQRGATESVSQIEEALERLDGALLRGGHRAQIYRLGETMMFVVQHVRDPTRNLGAGT